MQIVGQFCLLLILCSVLEFYKRVFRYILGFILMDCVSWFRFLSQTCDFGCGFLVYNCFRQLFNLLGLFILFNLGIKALQFGYHFKGLIKFLYGFSGKTSDLRNRVGLLDMVKKLESKKISSLHETNGNVDENGGLKSVFNDQSDDTHDEDDEFDVMSLRKMVKRERQSAETAYVELDKERLAASSAAEETMAMILRLQREKSLVEMEANQYRRLAEEKQIHDQEVIQSLRWIVMRHELERSYLEDQLRFYRRRLKIPSKDRDENEENDEQMSLFNSSYEDGSPCDGLVSSLDFDLSPL